MSLGQRPSVSVQGLQSAHHWWDVGLAPQTDPGTAPAALSGDDFIPSL